MGERTLLGCVTRGLEPEKRNRSVEGPCAQGPEALAGGDKVAFLPVYSSQQHGDYF